MPAVQALHRHAVRVRLGEQAPHAAVRAEAAPRSVAEGAVDHVGVLAPAAIFAGILWSFLPQPVRRQVRPGMEFLWLLPFLALCAWGAWQAGPAIESLCFTVKDSATGLPIADFRKQLDVNLTGVMVATQAFAPLLGVDRSLKGKPGRIVNISSVSGRQATPFLGPYAASKFGLEGLSEALRQEMMVFGIDVVVVAPGMVATPIWDKAEALDVEPYATTAFAGPIENVRFMAVKQGKTGLPADKVGQIVRRAVTARYPKPRYEVSRGGMGKLVLSLLSRRTVERLTANAIGLKRVRN